MTVCIGALSETDSSIVLISDRMLTSPALGSFEMDFDKYIQTKNSIILFADNATNQITIENMLKQKITPETAVEEIVKIVEDVVFELRTNLVNSVLQRYGLNVEQAKNLLITPINNPIHQKILQVLDSVSIDNQILVAGFDSENKPRIFGLDAIGNVVQFKFIDYSGLGVQVIGSGSIQAFNSLLFSRFSKRLSTSEVVYHVYSAKRHAEVAPGVGRETTLFVFNKDRKLAIIDENKIKKYYEKQQKDNNKAIRDFANKWKL